MESLNEVARARGVDLNQQLGKLGISGRTGGAYGQLERAEDGVLSHMAVGRVRRTPLSLNSTRMSLLVGRLPLLDPASHQQERKTTNGNPGKHSAVCFVGDSFLFISS